MLIIGSFFIAVRCGICSKFEIQEISLFELNKGKQNKFICQCGETEFYIKTDDYKTFSFTIPCPTCDGDHVFSFSLKKLLSSKGSAEKCSLTHWDMLLVGKKEWIEEHSSKTNREIDNIMEELGFDNYFNSPEVMIEALDLVHKIAEQENLYCDCGSKNIDMNLFPDRIELRCLACNSVSVIYAENKEDLNHLVNTSVIIMHEKTFACIDAIHYNGLTHK